MGAVAVAFVLMGIAFSVAFIAYTMGRNSVKPKNPKKRKGKITETEMPLIHPNRGHFCLICGCDTHKSTVFHDKKQHEIPKARYCDICGQGPGEKCDAGLHG